MRFQGWDQTPAFKKMVELLGGDNAAARAANALYREGMTSLRDLSNLQLAIGDVRFRQKVTDLRGFGPGAMQRLENVMSALRLGEIEEPPREASPVIPQDIGERLFRSLSVHEFAADEKEIVLGAYKGLTVGDLRGLYQLLHGW